jgi:hypothetical protein
MNNDQKSLFILFDILYILTDNKLIVHLGVKTMQHIKALRTRTRFAISSILGLCFALVTFSCATGENQVSDFSSDIEISAETVPEGIRVTFSNYSTIPLEMKDIGVVFRDWGGSEEPDWENIDEFAVVFNNTHDLRETTCFSVMEKVKCTGTVIFPFVQPGHKYFITAFLINNEDEIELTKTIECIADGGIFLNNNISLDLNNAHTGVALSNAPVFTSDVQFGGLGYHIIILTGDDYWDVFSDSNGELFWDFEPKFQEYLKEIGVVNGDYPAYVEANISITHDNTSWVMNIAKSPVFTYSL